MASVPFGLVGELMVIDQHRLQDDDYRAEVLAALLQAYQDGIWRYCVTRLGDVVGEEVAQDVFVTAWENLPTFRQEAAPSTWLFGIAKHKCAQTLRNRARRRAILAQAMDDVRSSAHAMAPETPEQRLAEQRQRRWLAESLAQLREGDRLLVTLHYLKGLSIKDIADLAGQSEAAVRKRLRRALQRLREMGDGP
jgi:RNA polymerase sigma-70 factor, ECF subfamily